MSQIQTIIEWGAEQVISFIGSSGQVGVFILMAAESTNIPIPSEIIMPFSGFLASIGRFNFWPLVFVGALGNLAGSLISYGIGVRGGRPFLERYGKYIFVSQKEIEKGDRAFAKYGLKVAFWSRMLPIIRTFISLPAGISKVSLKGFAVYTFLGSLVWSWLLAFFGFKLGENWYLVRPFFEKFSALIAGVIILGLMVYIWYHIKDRGRNHDS